MPEETQSRRRGAELERAILDVVWAELLDVGYARLTIDAVAARAGTSKPVLYRRWPGKAELVLAAWRARQPELPGAAEPDAEPDAGQDLRTDLVRLFRGFLGGVDELPPDVLPGLVSESVRDPDLLGLLREQIAKASPRHAVEAAVGRAVDRGELAPGARTALTPRVVALPMTLVRAEAAFGLREVTDDTIAELVDEVYLPLLRGLGR